MSHALRITLVQAASSTDPAANRASLRELEQRGVFDDTDLVVLPEAYARDFGSPGEDLAAAGEPLDGPFATALQSISETHDVSVLAGMFERGPDARPFNTLLLARPGESLAIYRKIHLYDSFGYRESDVLTPGETTPVTARIGGLEMGLMTCYDLRFPELARAMAGVDALLVPSAWVAGEGKVEHWRTLLRARAIENVCYVVGVGQPGPRYTGHSLVADPLGVVVTEAGEEPTVLTATLDQVAVAAGRRSNPSLENRRL